MRLEYGWYNRQGELIGRDTVHVPEGVAFIQQVIHLDGIEDNAAISTIMGAPQPSQDDAPAKIFGLSVDTPLGKGGGAVMQDDPATEQRPVYRKLRDGTGRNTWLITCDEGWRSTIVANGMYETTADWLLKILGRRPYAKLTDADYQQRRAPVRAFLGERPCSNPGCECHD